MFTACKKGQQYWQPDITFKKLNIENSTADEKESFNLRKITDGPDWLVINFFAPGCAPCIEEIPDLKEFYKEIKDDPKIRFVAIGSILDAIEADPVVTATEAAEDVAGFVKEYELPYPVYLASTTNLKDFRVSGFPETYLLYKDTESKPPVYRIRRKFISTVDGKTMRSYLNLYTTDSNY